MSLKPSELQNPERGMKVQSRETEAKRDEAKPDELVALLLQRIASAKGMTPTDISPHCADCFRRGWKAALREIEGG